MGLTASCLWQCVNPWLTKYEVPDGEFEDDVALDAAHVSQLPSASFDVLRPEDVVLDEEAQKEEGPAAQAVHFRMETMDSASSAKFQVRSADRCAGSSPMHGQCSLIDFQEVAGVGGCLVIGWGTGTTLYLGLFSSSACMHTSLVDRLSPASTRAPHRPPFLCHSSLSTRLPRSCLPKNSAPGATTTPLRACASGSRPSSRSPALSSRPCSPAAPTGRGACTAAAPSGRRGAWGVS